jgi:hypothetical protein
MYTLDEFLLINFNKESHIVHLFNVEAEASTFL